MLQSTRRLSFHFGISQHSLTSFNLSSVESTYNLKQTEFCSGYFVRLTGSGSVTMAAGGKGWKEQDGGGSGSWLLTGLKIGAALGVAALGAYAAVKVVEQEKKEEPMENQYCGSSREDDIREDSHSPPSHGSTRGSGWVPKPQRKPSGTLVCELNEFYGLHINSSSPKQMAIQDCVKKTGQRLSNYLMKNHRRLIKGELAPTALDELYSGQQAEYSLMLPMAFHPKMWELIDAADTVLDTPGFFCVRRVNLDFFQIGQSPWDKFLIGSYLCPELLVDFWKKMFERMLRDEMFLDFYCNVKRTAGWVELYIENPVGSHASMLCIKIIPYMKVKRGQETITITTQSVAHLQPPVRSSVKGTSSNPHENLWIRSREEEAVHKLKGLDRDGGCRKKCLAILDALRWTHPPLRMLSSYVMMTVLLNLCKEETEWEAEMLAERFLDLLKALEGYLRAGTVRDHFNDKVDILSQCCSPGLIGESQRWLALALESKESISALLYD